MKNIWRVHHEPLMEKPGAVETADEPSRQVSGSGRRTGNRNTSSTQQVYRLRRHVRFLCFGAWPLWGVGGACPERGWSLPYLLRLF